MYCTVHYSTEQESTVQAIKSNITDRSPCLLHQLLRLEETLEMLDLPCSHHQKDSCLSQGPPQHPLVGALAGLSEPLLSVPLVVLLLGDLFHLVQQLPHSQLQLR